MRKRNLLLTGAAFLTCAGMSAVEFADGSTPLLPDGVTINYDQNKHFWGQKTLTVITLSGNRTAIHMPHQQTGIRAMNTLTSLVMINTTVLTGHQEALFSIIMTVL